MADSEYVTVRHEGTKDERDIHRDAVPFFTNQGYVVLTSDGRVNTKATAAANSKEN